MNAAIIIIGVCAFFGAFSAAVYYLHRWMVSHDKTHIKEQTLEFLMSDKANRLMSERLKRMAGSYELGDQIIKKFIQNDVLKTKVRDEALRQTSEIVENRRHQIEDALKSGLNDIENVQEEYREKIRRHEDAVKYMGHFYHIGPNGPEINSGALIHVNKPHYDIDGNVTWESEQVTIEHLLSSFLTLDEFLKEYELGMVDKAG